MNLNEKTMNPSPEGFRYRAFTEKMDAQRAVSEIPILGRKEFITLLLWRNLNWKFVILILSVHNLGSK